MRVCWLVVVKGKWERKPADWPENVPFLDPSNRVKTDGGLGPKPTKDILEKMFVHLVAKYVSLILFAGWLIW